MEHFVEVESAVEPNGCSRRYRRQQIQQPENMRGGCCDLEAVIGPKTEHGAPMCRGMPHRLVRVTHGLGQSRRPGTEHEDGFACVLRGR